MNAALDVRKAATKSKVLSMQKYAEAQSRDVQQTAMGNSFSCCTFVALENIKSANV